MSTFAAARSVFRSAAGRTALGSRISAGARSKPPSSPCRLPKQNQNRLSLPSFRRRSAVETSRCVELMLPYHTATTSALHTSKLYVSCRTHSWSPEDT